MKEEEAKTVIKEYLYNHRFGYIAKDAEFDRLYEAMKVAIQALEQSSGDAVSRQAVLEKMADYVASGYADSTEDFEEYSRIICQLPSVNPQKNIVNNGTMNITL